MLEINQKIFEDNQKILKDNQKIFMKTVERIIIK